MSSGLQNVPEFMAIAVVDGVRLGSCDSNNRTAKPKQDWTKKLTEDDPDHLDWNTQLCRRNHDASKVMIQEIQLLFNQTGGSFHQQNLISPSLSTYGYTLT